MKNNKFKIMTAVGIIALAIGAYGYDYTPSADAALEDQCRANLRQRGAESMAMASRCGERAFASAMTARDANSAARAISSANQAGILGHMGAMFCLGLGGVLFIVGILGLFGIVRPRKS